MCPVEPVHVFSGADAVHALDAIQLAAVVIDPDVPGGLGRQARERLREASRSSRIPLRYVVVPAQDAGHVATHYGPVGDRLLGKPLDP